MQLIIINIVINILINLSIESNAKIVVLTIKYYNHIDIL